MHGTNNEETLKKDKEIYPDENLNPSVIFLGLKYWLKRIKFNTKFWLTYLVIFGIWLISGWVVFGIDYYIQHALFIIDIIYLVIPIGVIIIGPKYLKSYIQLVFSCESIFLKNEDFKKFMFLTKDYINSLKGFK